MRVALGISALSAAVAACTSSSEFHSAPDEVLSTWYCDGGRTFETIEGGGPTTVTVDGERHDLPYLSDTREGDEFVTRHGVSGVIFERRLLRRYERSGVIIRWTASLKGATDIPMRNCLPDPPSAK